MTRRLCGALLIALTVTVGARQDRNATDRPQSTTGWTAFVDRFLNEPDHVGDLSPAAFGEDLARTRTRLAELRAIDASQLSPDEALDRRFAETLLVRREIDQAQMRRWRMDPRVYMQSLDALAEQLDRSGDPRERAAAVLRLLKAIPQDLRFGRRNLTLFVPRFQELALALASARSTTLENDVTEFADSVSDQEDALLAANSVAQEALSNWVDYLSKELPKRPAGYAVVGIATYNAILRGQHLLPYDVDELYEFARREFDRTLDELKDLAENMDDSQTWLELVGDVEADDADSDKAVERYRDAVKTARANLAGSALVAVSWQDLLEKWRIDRDDSGAADLFGKPDPAVMLVRAHGAYGDRVRALYQAHNTSALRRARGASIFADGWRLYVEQLVEEKKLFADDRAHLRLLQLRLLAIARVAVDIGLHTHRLTDAQATTLLTDRVGVTKAAAELEVAAATDDPGSRLGYLGSAEITRLRDDVRKSRGEAFSLSDFHERLLKIGALPLPLMREAMVR